MGLRRPSWKDRYPDRVTCVRCLQPTDTVELDRLLWCERCQDLARARAVDRGWWVGGVVAAGLAVYIWTFVEPSERLLGAWVGITLAAFYLAARMGREILYGVERAKNLPAVEAVPPDDTPDDSPDDEAPPQIRLRD